MKDNYKITMKSFKEIVHPLATWKFWKELITMTLGMAVGAAAVYYCLMPSKLVIGSISGLSIVLAEIFISGPRSCRMSA